MSKRPLRVPAAELCLERGWAAGTVLCSTQWKVPRKLGQRVQQSDLGKHIRVIVLKPNGDSLREEFLESFPDDTVVFIAHARHEPSAQGT